MRPRDRLERMNDEQLLDMRFCDLHLRIEGTPLEERLARLNYELDSRGLRFMPHVWISREWFTPDGVPGFAIPFYLAHPRLMKLERKQMLEVEGGGDAECMRIMRHEAGHAISNAYRLHFKRRWRELFGPFTQDYPTTYKPRPNSRNYVLHLKTWYAQAHPAEDFAETFAIWLTPNSRWRTRYHGWPALNKLEYVDELMKDIAGRSPVNRQRNKVESMSSLKMTLREHYEEKRSQYAVKTSGYYDKDLKRIFLSGAENASRPTAAGFIRAARRELRHVVAEGTGVHQYTIDHVLESMIERSKRLKLRVPLAKNHAKRQLLIMLTVHTMNVIHAGYHRISI